MKHYRKFDADQTTIEKFDVSDRYLFQRAYTFRNERAELAGNERITMAQYRKKLILDGCIRELGN